MNSDAPRLRLPTTPVTATYAHSAPCGTLRSIVNRLLGSIPIELSSGIREVRLVDAPRSRAARRSKPSRRSTVALADAQGMYSHGVIELYVDNLLAGWPAWSLHVPLLGSFLVARVLYHEIGRHIAAVTRPTHRHSEETAETWARVLLAAYFRRRYPVVSRLAALLSPLVPIIERRLQMGPIGPVGRE